MGCHILLQGIFPTQGLNLGLPHCGQTLYRLSHQGSPLLSDIDLQIFFPTCGLSFHFFFPPSHRACGILVPQPGIEFRSMAVKAHSPNHWTTREFWSFHFFDEIFCSTEAFNFHEATSVFFFFCLLLGAPGSETLNMRVRRIRCLNNLGTVRHHIRK